MSGNMYKGVETKKNALRGRCEHECIYCSTHRLRLSYPACKSKYEGPYTIDTKVINSTWGEGHTYFICSQNDLFAKGVPHYIQRRILNKASWYPKNVYMWQSKNPKGMEMFLDRFPSNSWLGTTIETNRDMQHISKAPNPQERANSIRYIGEKGFKTYITIEPIMKFDFSEFFYMLIYAKPTKIFIGADSKKNHLPEPTAYEVNELINKLRNESIDVKIKDNLKRIVKGEGKK